MSLNKTFTGAVENVGGGTAMTFGAIAAKAVIANATNASAVPAALAGSAAFQHLRVNSANNALEWATLSGYASTSITYTSDTFQRAALSGAVSASANSNATTFSGVAANTSLITPARTFMNFIAGTHTTVSGTTNATDILISYSVDLTTLLAAIDSTSIVVSGSTLQRAALTGDVTAAANSNATTIANSAVTDAKIRDSAGFSVIGRAGSTTGAVADITANPGIHTGMPFKLNNSGTALGFAQLSDLGIADEAVTNPKLAHMAANTVKVNNTGSIGDPTDLSMATNTVLIRSGSNIVAQALAGGETLANTVEGNTSSGLTATDRPTMLRTLLTAQNVRIFDEDFQGQLAQWTASSSRFAIVSGFADIALSGTNTSDFIGALNLASNSSNGTTRGVFTVGANENALNWNLASWRYIRMHIRVGASGTTANTGVQCGLVANHTTYQAGTAGIGGTGTAIYWQYRTDANSGLWVAGTRQSSSDSQTASGLTATANTNYELEIFRFSNGSLQYFINGTLVRTDNTAGTQALSGGCTFFITQIGSTTANRNVQIDHLRIISET